MAVAPCPACGFSVVPGAVVCGRCRRRIQLPRTAAARAARVSFPRTTYLGGHPRRAAQMKSVGLLVFDEHGIHLTGFVDVFVIAWADVLDVLVEEPEATVKRLSSTQVVPLDVFALASHKRSDAAFVSVVTATFSAVFEVDRIGAEDLRAQIAPWTAELPGA
jgi:hypothetical protein